MSRLQSKFVEFIDTSLCLFFATSCLVCKKNFSKEMVCESCLMLSKLDKPLCLKCGNPVSQEMVACGFCSKDFLLDRLRTTYWLFEKEKRLLHLIKYQKRFEIFSMISKIDIGESISEFKEIEVVVPVPLFKDNFFKRSFNQSLILSKIISKMIQVPISDQLIKINKTKSQSWLTKKQRAQNLKNTFLWKGKTVPRGVLLVDDTFTTGATLSACAKALRRVGIERVMAWTLFRTPLESMLSIRPSGV